MTRAPPSSTLFPYTTLFRSGVGHPHRVRTRLLQHRQAPGPGPVPAGVGRSEEHTSELQSRENLVCRLLVERKNSIEPDRSRRPYVRSLPDDVGELRESDLGW